jgi:ATP-binding cassette subfamily B protein
LLLSLGLILVVSASINYLPVLIKQLTDQCLLDTTVSAELRLDRLGRIGLLYLSIAVAGYSLRYIQGLLTAWTGQRIIYDLRVAVFRKALRMQQAWFDRMPVGTLMTRVTSDVERLENFVTEGVVGTVADLFMLLGIMSYMIVISPHLFGVLFLLLPPLFALLVIVNRRLRDANRMINSQCSAAGGSHRHDNHPAFQP